MAIPNKLQMISTLFKLLFILLSFVIFKQDSKDREVYWFLYPLTSIASIVLQLTYCQTWITFINIGINLTLVVVMLFTNWLYVLLIMKKRRFINEVIGTGDILFLLCLTTTFATIAFTVVLIFSMLFSLLLHIFMKDKSRHATIPLAGYMALFFSGIYIISFISSFNDLLYSM